MAVATVAAKTGGEGGGEGGGGEVVEERVVVMAVEATEEVKVAVAMVEARRQGGALYFY